MRASRHRTMPDMRGPRTLRSGLVATCADRQVGFDDLDPCELLGQGAYGMVHRMIEKDTGQCRVMKTVVRPEGWDDERLKLEAEILQNLDHPHILRLFSWYEEGDTVNLVMEHCDGGELLKLVREGRKRGQPLPERWAATVIMQSFQALVYIHAKGVVHKDLKGQNLLLLHRTEDSRGNIFGLIPHVIVCDLGIAEICCRGIFGMRGSRVAGTPATMAPEVWKGACSPKSDVWSMGCVMFELFTNRLPFQVIGNIQQAALMQSTWLDLHRKGPDWDKLKASSDAKAFNQQCLTYKEGSRPSALDSLKHPWFESSGCNALTPEEINSLTRSVAYWRERSPMQRALCLKMAVGCTCISKFARLFSKFDTDCSGVLERAEIVTALMSLGIEKATAKKTAAALDINNDNSCEYLEFVAACLSSLEEQFDELLRQEFRMLDRGSKGELNEKEIKALMKELEPLAVAHGLQLEDIDTNGDGQISYDEFCGYFGRPGVTYVYNIKPASKQNASNLPMKQHVRIVCGTGTLEQSLDNIKRSMDYSMEKRQTDPKLGAAARSRSPGAGNRNAGGGSASSRGKGSAASATSSPATSKAPSSRRSSKDAGAEGSVSSRKSAADAEVSTPKRALKERQISAGSDAKAGGASPKSKAKAKAKGTPRQPSRTESAGQEKTQGGSRASSAKPSPTATPRGKAAGPAAKPDSVAAATAPVGDGTAPTPGGAGTATAGGGGDSAPSHAAASGRGNGNGAGSVASESEPRWESAASVNGPSMLSEGTSKFGASEGLDGLVNAGQEYAILNTALLGVEVNLKGSTRGSEVSKISDEGESRVELEADCMDDVAMPTQAAMAAAVEGDPSQVQSFSSFSMKSFQQNSVTASFEQHKAAQCACFILGSPLSCLSSANKQRVGSQSLEKRTEKASSDQALRSTRVSL